MTKIIPNTTVIITHWNTPQDLMARCMKSVIETGLEYIIVDDGSDPEYRDFLSAYDNVILLPKNVGTYKAFEVALNTITTPYVTRMDSDDYFVSTPVIYGDHDAYANTIGGMVKLKLDEFSKAPYAGLNGITVKTEVLKAVWCSKMRSFCDAIMFARILREYDVVANKVDNYRYCKRKGNSITNSENRVEKAKRILKIIRRENDSYINKKGK